MLVTNILTDPLFKHPRDVLSGKRKELKLKEKGNREKKAEPLISQELNILYEKGHLGSGSPIALINTVWWNNTIHFGKRSRQEHIDVEWGDVELSTTSSGDEFLQFCERITKTKTGLSDSTHPFHPKMFAVPGNSRCLVQMYTEFARRRLQAFNKHEESSFYFSVNPNGTSCYSRQGMGGNKICSLMKVMCENAGIRGRKVNHSARKTSVTCLLHGDIPPTQIMQLTGHKNVNSINSYSSASLNQQKEMSTLLSSLTAETAPKKAPVSTVQRDDFNDDLVWSSDFEDTFKQIEGNEVKTPNQKRVSGSISSSTSTKCASTTGQLLSDARICGNITINMNCSLDAPSEQAPLKPYKRIRLIESESDSE